MRSLPRPASFDSIPNHFTLTVEYWNPWVTSNAIAKITFLVLFQWDPRQKEISTTPIVRVILESQTAVVNGNNNITCLLILGVSEIVWHMKITLWTTKLLENLTISVSNNIMQSFYWLFSRNIEWLHIANCHPTIHHKNNNKK